MLDITFFNLRDRLFFSFCATRRHFRPICPTLIIFKWWNGPTATDKRQSEWGREERTEWNLTSDVLSWLAEAWQGRCGSSFSSGHTDEYEDENFLGHSLWMSLICHLLPFSKLYNHIRILLNPSTQPCTACYFASKKTSDIFYLTLLKLLSKSQLTLNGFKWHTQMFNDVQSVLRCSMLHFP